MGIWIQWGVVSRGLWLLGLHHESFSPCVSNCMKVYSSVRSSLLSRKGEKGGHNIVSPQESSWTPEWGKFSLCSYFNSSLITADLLTFPDIPVSCTVNSFLYVLRAWLCLFSCNSNRTTIYYVRSEPTISRTRENFNFTLSLPTFSASVSHRDSHQKNPYPTHEF